MARIVSCDICGQPFDSELSPNGLLEIYCPKHRVLSPDEVRCKGCSYVVPVSDTQSGLCSACRGNGRCEDCGTPLLQAPPTTQDGLVERVCPKCGLVAGRVKPQENVWPTDQINPAGDPSRREWVGGHQVIPLTVSRRGSIVRRNSPTN